MATRHFCIFLLAALFAAPLSIATAQIAPIGPFSGANAEDFGALLNGTFACHPMPILGGTARLCSTHTGKVFVGGDAHCSCVQMPKSNAHALVGNFSGGMGHARITFGTPAVRFGGYFGLNCNVPDGRADFFDDTGALIASMPLTVPADCGWYWQGFEVTSGPPIASVELLSNLGNGQNLIMDELEVDYAASVATYCTAKFNSLNCTPRIEVHGFPQAGATRGWAINATQVRGGVPGILLYTVGGSRAAVSFSCGTLCIGPAGVRRAVPVQSSFGQLCTGVYSIDMNAFAAGGGPANPAPALSIPGTLVHAQWWGRDQGFPPPCNTTLTNAVEYVIQ